VALTAEAVAVAASRTAEVVVDSALARLLPTSARLLRLLPRLVAVVFNFVPMAAEPPGRVSAAAEVEVITASVTAVVAADFFPVRLPAR
jgi:hypothetical protein